MAPCEDASCQKARDRFDNTDANVMEERVSLGLVIYMTLFMLVKVFVRFLITKGLLSSRPGPHCCSKPKAGREGREGWCCGRCGGDATPKNSPSTTGIAVGETCDPKNDTR